MRRIALLALLLAFAAAVYGQENILEKGLEGRSAADVISRRYVTPLRLVALPGELTADPGLARRMAEMARRYSRI